MRFKEEEILKVERQIQSLKQQLKFLEGRLEKLERLPDIDYNCFIKDCSDFPLTKGYITFLNLNIGTMICPEGYRAATIGDLISLTHEKLMEVPYIKEKRAKLIEVWMEEYGLFFIPQMRQK